MKFVRSAYTSARAVVLLACAVLSPFLAVSGLFTGGAVATWEVVVFSIAGALCLYGAYGFWSVQLHITDTHMKVTSGVGTRQIAWTQVSVFERKRRFLFAFALVDGERIVFDLNAFRHPQQILDQIEKHVGKPLLAEKPLPAPSAALVALLAVSLSASVPLAILVHWAGWVIGCAIGLLAAGAFLDDPSFCAKKRSWKWAAPLAFSTWCLAGSWYLLEHFCVWPNIGALLAFSTLACGWGTGFSGLLLVRHRWWPKKKGENAQ